MTEYTQNANDFINDLISSGIEKKDIHSHFVSKGKQVLWPYIGEDGKPHINTKTFR